MRDLPSAVIWINNALDCLDLYGTEEEIKVYIRLLELKRKILEIDMYEKQSDYNSKIKDLDIQIVELKKNNGVT